MTEFIKKYKQASHWLIESSKLPTYLWAFRIETLPPSDGNAIPARPTVGLSFAEQIFKKLYWYKKYNKPWVRRWQHPVYYSIYVPHGRWQYLSEPVNVWLFVMSSKEQFWEGELEKTLCICMKDVVVGDV